MELIKDEELEGTAGGFEKVSDPIYSLTFDEKKVLEKLGYRLDKTKSGNYRVYYSNGCTIEPHVLENMCKAIPIAKNLDNYSNRW